MTLKMVTWDGDLTQFLVEAETNDEAISKAIYANKECDRYLKSNDPDDPDITDPTSYTVDDVDFDLLCEIVERSDWVGGRFGEAKVFND